MMEIRLCDITNNNTDIRDYFLVEDGKILINGNHLYDVILDTDKVTLHQQMEMFDSKDEIFKKAKAFDLIKKHVDEEVDNYMTLYRETKDPVYSLLNSHYDTLLGYMEELERADDER